MNQIMRHILNIYYLEVKEMLSILRFVITRTRQGGVWGVKLI